MVLPKASDLKFIKRVPVEATRLERLDQLKQYFLNFLVEDPQDGSGFDCNVLNVIEGLGAHYKDNEDDNGTTFYATTDRPAPPKLREQGTA